MKEQQIICLAYPIPANWVSSICCFLLILFSAELVAQKPFSPYTQTIPGTEETINMLPIQGGTFQMGSPVDEPGHRVDEGPVHTVTVDSFWMAEVEISWNLYNLFVDRVIDAQQPKPVSGSEVALDVDAITGATEPYIEMSFGMGTDGYPAICMTQLAAARFCAWLSAMTGNFYRLPTEAEWEYAARAGSVQAFSFGSDSTLLDRYAWFEENSDGKYQKTGTKQPNAWGLYDMHGNVAEWTLDQYLEEAYGQRKGAVGNPFEIPTKTYPRAVRGGSWKDPAHRLRSAARQPSKKIWKRRDPQIPKSKWWHTDASFVGFRIVRPLKTPSEAMQKVYWRYED